MVSVRYCDSSAHIYKSEKVQMLYDDMFQVYAKYKKIR